MAAFSAVAIHREMGHHGKNSTLAELVFHCLKQIRKPSKVRHTYTRRKADGLSSSNHAKISRGGSFSFFFIVSLIQRVGDENISVIKQQGISNSQHTYKSKSSNQYYPVWKRSFTNSIQYYFSETLYTFNCGFMIIGFKNLIFTLFEAFFKQYL